MNVLVTGATGFIGSHLCRALLEEKHEVFALSHTRRNERIASLLSQKCFHLVSGDVCSLPKMQEVMERNKIDAVIHLAAYGTHGLQESFHNPTHLETNVEGTLNILQASLLVKCSKIVYASSREVYGVPNYLPIDETHPAKPVNFYGLTKLQGESYCEFYAQNYKLHAVVLRYAGVYGPGKTKGAVYNFIQAALRDQPLQTSSDGNQTRDLVYVGDVVDATMKALNITNDITFDVFNVGSGREISINKLARTIIKVTGKSIDFAHSHGSSGDRFFLDIAKARRSLSYQPRPLEDTLTEFIHYLKLGV